MLSKQLSDLIDRYYKDCTQFLKGFSHTEKVPITYWDSFMNRRVPTGEYETVPCSYVTAIKSIEREFFNLTQYYIKSELQAFEPFLENSSVKGAKKHLKEIRIFAKNHNDVTRLFTLLEFLKKEGV